MDAMIAVFIFPAAWLLRFVRANGVYNFVSVQRVLLRLGVFPIINHYYEPCFDFRLVKGGCDKPRDLPGISWNVSGQLDLLAQLNYSDELLKIDIDSPSGNGFWINNPNFKSGDAEYWYNVVRFFRPAKIIEVGSGYSTIMARIAIEHNIKRDRAYHCKQLCIEPYEMAWLDRVDVELVRTRVEDMDISVFKALKENDILFIDSSHVIRPRGDVLREILQIIPSLNKGVIVHLHDIFSPRDYLAEWIYRDIKFWNEQYLLEAFLTSNKEWEIIAALNFLKHYDYELLKSVCPFMSEDREPGSFYIRKIV
jgi:Methyltransferase domain